MVANEVLRVEANVETGLGLVAGMVVAIRNVRFAAKDRLDLRKPLEVLLRGAAGIVERLQRKEISMVRDRKRGHAPFAGTLHERIYLALPVKQGIGGVKVQMDEVAHVTSPRS